MRAVATMPAANRLAVAPRKEAMTEDNTTEEESRDAGDKYAGLPYWINWHSPRWVVGEDFAASVGFSFYAESFANELNRIARERDTAREEAEAMKSRLKWAEAAVAKLEADIAAGSERAVMTSPIADGGRYTTLNERIVSNQIRLDEGVFNQNPASFSAVSYSGKHANMFCARLNRERDGRIAAEAELAALKAQHANGSGIPNGSGGDGEDLYPVEQIVGLWYVQLTPTTLRLGGTEFAANAFSKRLKELGAARLAAEIRAQAAESNLKVQTDRANALERELHQERTFSDGRKAAQAEAATLRAKLSEAEKFGSQMNEVSRADMHEVERLRSELKDAEETLAKMEVALDKANREAIESRTMNDRYSDNVYLDETAMRVLAGGHVATAEQAFAQAARLVSERARRDAEGGAA